MRWMLRLLLRTLQSIRLASQMTTAAATTPLSFREQLQAAREKELERTNATTLAALNALFSSYDVPVDALREELMAAATNMSCWQPSATCVLDISPLLGKTLYVTNCSYTIDATQMVFVRPFTSNRQVCLLEIYKRVPGYKFILQVIRDAFPDVDELKVAVGSSGNLEITVAYKLDRIRPMFVPELRDD